ncbi:Bcr/CflA family efflux MFS transporter [Ancylobacter sp. 6x-1]|uniref:Bcr/CflA family efflux transporter n=1 Tax=Ancylobacter crimeensis TaxID=2579147 RepID=A0ABT0D8Z9_9HYPH|nr:Bcr/CflA family efflux MFS transporter [Ancylobacter crimeensis]MCK0196415.1 Bcr/CflA family efflux MFS transporter [Ancylobacter crimeensis]
MTKPLPSDTPNHSGAHVVPPPNVLMMAGATALPTFSMHVFVPALPAAALALSATPAAIQLTVTLYLIGLALGQIVHGPLSDRIGRRPVILGGFLIYIVGTAGAWAAPSLPLLLAARVLQSVGSCAGLVVGRAAIRETASASSAAAGLAVLTFTITISSALAPLIGAGLDRLLGWRMIFAVLLAASILVTALLYVRFPETNRARQADIGVGQMLHRFAALARSRAFMGYSLAGAAATVTAYAFYAALPFLVAEELPGAEPFIGFIYLGVVAGSILGALTARRATRHMALERIALVGACGTVAAACAFLGGRLIWPGSVLSVTVPLFAMTYAGGFASPGAATLAMSVDSRAVGAASSLYGFIQMAVGAGLTALVGLLGHGSVPVGAIVVGATLAGLAGYGLARPARH